MTYDKHDCDAMCERLAAYMEGDLSPDERAEAERHLSECSGCAEALVELRAIAAEAAQLPLLTPSRDLWAGIEARIGTPVTTIASAKLATRRAPRRQWQLAMAAAALIAVSAGTTYLVTRTGTPAAATNLAQRAPVQNGDSTNASAPTLAPSPVQQAAPAPIAPRNASLASRSKKELSAARVYDLEITMLDSLVRNHREALDPKTVAVIEQNLRIIDSAITESRAALAKDPKSPMLSNQLDNVLGSKVELLRTVAFLPTQS